MTTVFSQTSRSGRLVTSLGDDVLALRAIRGHEGLGVPFEYDVEAVASRPVDLGGLVGTHASVCLTDDRHGATETWFDGIVTAARALGIDHDGIVQGLTLRPWFHMATLRKDQRIFHDRTIPEILDEVFEAYSGFGQRLWEWDLGSGHPKNEYTVQYRESDFVFAQRLMERAGLSYRFDVAHGRHTMVLFDRVNRDVAVPGGSRRLVAATGDPARDAEHFTQWYPAHRFVTQAVRSTSFDFKAPSVDLEMRGDAPTGRGAAHAGGSGGLESYEFPGDYHLPEDAVGATGLRADQESHDAEAHVAVGDCLRLRPGMHVTVEDGALDGVTGKTFLCTETSFRFSGNAYSSGARRSAGYDGTYGLKPEGFEMRPAPRMPPPRVSGPQTAIVVGEGEIDCDEYGRILVRFHWDLERRHSMRCRVSQNWAGAGWGGMAIPRVGMEVVVTFLEGHPDQPLVTGCVYNGEAPPPYALPEHATRSTFKTETSPRAAGPGFNELRFEDRGGAEEIFVHAQRDMNAKVGRNLTRQVDAHMVESVGGNAGSEVAANATQVVGGDLSVSVGPSHRGRVAPPDAASRDQGIADAADRVGRDAAGDGSMSLDVARNRASVVGRDDRLRVARDLKVQVGRSHRIEVGETLEIDVGDRVVLNCGRTRLTMEKDGTVAIDGVQLTLKAQDLFRVLSAVAKIN
ncbi:MAG: type VI secretion system Vgr family protein [Shimia sp.]